MKMKPVDVNLSAYIDVNEESNKEDPKFEVGDHVRISNYKNNFAKDYTQNWSADVFVTRIVKNSVPLACC